MYLWYVALTHFALAVLLFYLVNWIGAKSKPLDFGYVQMSVGIQDDTAPLFNYFFKVLAPVVFIILVAAVFQSVGLKAFNKNLYWIVIDYWGFRFLYIAIRGQVRLLNWPLQIFYWISSIALSVWVYSLIDKIGSILPNPADLIEELWILIIIFLYSIFNKLQYSRKGAERRIKKYTESRYQKFKSKYGKIVDEALSLDHFKALVYAIMVYEDFNRPKFARFVERTLFFKSKRPHTYGVMQVMSQAPLSDEESVIQGISKIKSLAKIEIDSIEDVDTVYAKRVIYAIAEKYNPGDHDYCDQVEQVYNNIIESFYADIEEHITIADALASIGETTK